MKGLLACPGSSLGIPCLAHRRNCCSQTDPISLANVQLSVICLSRGELVLLLVRVLLVLLVLLVVSVMFSPRRASKGKQKRAVGDGSQKFRKQNMTVPRVVNKWRRFLVFGDSRIASDR